MNSSKEFQNFLDQQQYNRRGILKYEFIFGEDFVSVGGAELNRELSKKLEIKPEHRILGRVQIFFCYSIFKLFQFKPLKRYRLWNRRKCFSNEKCPTVPITDRGRP